MERKSRKDVILAGILAVFIHAAFLAWSFPSGWMPHYEPGPPASAYAVKLVARRPAAEVRPQQETRAESKPGPAAKPSPKTRAKEQPVPKPPSETHPLQDRKRALPCAVKKPQPKPIPQPTPQPSDRGCVAAEQAESPQEESPGKNGQSSRPDLFESMQRPEGAPCPSSTGQETQQSTQGLPSFIEAQPPRYGYRQEPDYPRLAVRRGYEGTALLRVRVLEDGRVGAVELRESSGHRILDKSASEAVKTWHFVPARRGGEKMASWVLVPITFRLR